MTLKLTPDEWLNTLVFDGVVVYDPEGWNKENLEDSWAEVLTLEEMWNRVHKSLCLTIRTKKPLTNGEIK